MIPLETKRLILRKYTENDFSAVHSYGSCRENLIYMLWGPNNEEQTREYINRSIERTEENPIKNYIYAVVLKETNKLIGGCEIALLSDYYAEIGWILHRDYWKQGYGAEMGKALLKFGFEELNLHRIIATCDVENYGSYRVMEKIGMRREGLFIEARPANKLSAKKYSDELWYGILKREWENQKWDPDFTKVTPEEAERINAAEDSGFLFDSEIDWDKIGHGE